MILNNPTFSIDNHFSNYNTDDLTEEILLSSSTDIYNIKPDLSDIINETLNYKESIENERKVDKKRSFFKIKKKRGRKFNKDRKQQEHTALDDDNIKRKIQGHFLNFVVSFSNDCLHNFSLDKKMSFQKFNYSKKTQVKKDYFQKIKNFSIKEIFEFMGISEKCKKYLDFFSLYYNDRKLLKQKTILGKVINISKETKSFYDLLEKYKNSKEYKNILNGATIFFLEDNDNKDSKSDKKDIIDLNEN